MFVNAFWTRMTSGPPSILSHIIRPGESIVADAQSKKHTQHLPLQEILLIEILIIGELREGELEFFQVSKSKAIIPHRLDTGFL
jgi:hypothetical protein